MLLFATFIFSFSNTSDYLYQHDRSLIEFDTQDIQVYRADDVNNNFVNNPNSSMHIIYVDELENNREVAKVFQKTKNLCNSSSLIIIVTSSSESSSDDSSSTICLDLTETHSIWNCGTSDLHRKFFIHYFS